MTTRLHYLFHLFQHRLGPAESDAALGAFVRELWQLNPQWDVDDALQAVTDVANFIAEQEKQG